MQTDLGFSADITVDVDGGCVPQTDKPQLRILWLYRPDYAYGFNHGGHLRCFNLSRLLIEKKHIVRLLVPVKSSENTEIRQHYLEDLQRKNIINGHFEIPYPLPQWTGKLARLLVHPGFKDFSLRKSCASVIGLIRRYITENRINLFIISDRNFLFLMRPLHQHVAMIVDWVDSFVLYYYRDIAQITKQRDWMSLLGAIKLLLSAQLQERYYSKLADINLVVSPVDQKWLGGFGGASERLCVLMNGVDIPEGLQDISKVDNQIIFTGNMDFPPNYKSALWLIDNVMPLVHKKKTDVKLLIAGPNPISALLERSSPTLEVTGFVPDLRWKIAESRLYVAPLVCGGGFKNKIVEAIACGTFVVATSMAVEFLGHGIRQQLLMADGPQDMAKAILNYLDNPNEYDTRLPGLRQTLKSEFSWERRVIEMINLARTVLVQ